MARIIYLFYPAYDLIKTFGRNSMGSFCGIIDFSARNTNFDAMTKMWKTMAPLCRGYSYVRGGIALVCEKGKYMSATRPAPTSSGRRENCTVMLSSPPSSPLFASELLCRYANDGLWGLGEATREASFVLVDEKEKLLALFSGDCPIFCARSGEKIVFATCREALVAFSVAASSPLLVCPVEISPMGTALFCDVKSE